MSVPSGQFHDHAHIEQEILKGANWIRRACLMRLNEGEITAERITAMLTDISAELVYWFDMSQQRRGSDGTD